MKALLATSLVLAVATSYAAQPATTAKAAAAKPSVTASSSATQVAKKKAKKKKKGEQQPEQPKATSSEEAPVAKTAPKAAAPAAQAVAAPAPAAKPAAPSAQVAPVTGASAIKTAEATKEAKPKKFFGMINSWNEAAAIDSSKGNTVGDFAATETIRLGYKITPTVSLSVSDDIDHTWATDSSGKTNVTYNDPYLMIAKSGMKLGALNNSTFLRYYVPTSADSVNKSSLGVFRAGLNSGINLTDKLELSFNVQPRLYMSQYSDFKDAKGVVNANKAYRLYYHTQLAYNITEKLAVAQLVGMDHHWFMESNGAKNSDIRQDKLVLQTGASYQLTSAFNLGAGANQYAMDLNQQNDPAGRSPIYRDDATVYYIEGNLQF